MKKIALFSNHHFDLRFILTPLALTIWTVDEREIKMLYIFGVRIARIHIK